MADMDTTASSAAIVQRTVVVCLRHVASVEVGLRLHLLHHNAYPAAHA